VHAFVDESERPGRYLMCAVVIAPAHLAAVRQALTALRMPGQRRLHMDHERDRRRRLILDRIAELPIRANVYQQPGQPIHARTANLWAADAIAWAYGAGRDWRRRIWHLLAVRPGQRETRAPTVR